MASLKKMALCILGQSKTVDMSVDADTDLFTVPVGMVATVVMVVISKASADLTTAEVSFGLSTAKTDFLTAQTLSALSSQNSAGICQILPNATPVEIQTYAAGEIFVMDVTTTGAGTATVTAIGYLEAA